MNTDHLTGIDPSGDMRLSVAPPFHLRERTARSANEHRIDLGGEPTNDEEPAGTYGIPEARGEQQNGGDQDRSEHGTHSRAESDR